MRSGHTPGATGRGATGILSAGLVALAMLPAGAQALVTPRVVKPNQVQVAPAPASNAAPASSPTPVPPPAPAPPADSAPAPSTDTTPISSPSDDGAPPSNPWAGDPARQPTGPALYMRDPNVDRMVAVGAIGGPAMVDYLASLIADRWNKLGQSELDLASLADLAWLGQEWSELRHARELETQIAVAEQGAYQAQVASPAASNAPSVPSPRPPPAPTSAPASNPDPVATPGDAPPSGLEENSGGSAILDQTADVRNRYVGSPDFYVRDPSRYYFDALYGDRPWQAQFAEWIADPSSYPELSPSMQGLEVLSRLVKLEQTLSALEHEQDLETQLAVREQGGYTEVSDAPNPCAGSESYFDSLAQVEEGIDGTISC